MFRESWNKFEICLTILALCLRYVSIAGVRGAVAEQLCALPTGCRVSWFAVNNADNVFSLTSFRMLEMAINPTYSIYTP